MQLLNQALDAQRNGRLQEAERLYREIIAAEPGQFDALHMLGIVCSQTGKPDEAEAFFRAALTIDSRFPPCFHNYGLFLAKRKRFDESIQQFDEALKLAANFAPAHCDRGISLMELGRLDESIAAHNTAAALAPNVAAVFYNRGNTLFKMQDYAAALRDYEQAVSLRSNHAEAFCGRGNACVALQRHTEAIVAYDTALGINPNLIDAWLGRGNALKELKRHDEAFAALKRAVALNPDLIEASVVRGELLRDLKHYDDALAAFNHALGSRPEAADAWLGRANTLGELKRHDEALAAFERVLALKPNLAEAWLGRGNVLIDAGRVDEALTALARALELKPDLAAAWLARGNAFAEQRRHEEALEAYGKALAFKPELAEAWLGRGNVFGSLGRYDEAFAALDKTLALKPALPGVEGQRLHMKLNLCEWGGFDTDAERLIASIRSGKPSSVPFALLSVPCSLADQLQCARLWIADKYPAPAKEPLRGNSRGHDRIRLAYLSADFRDHPVSYLLAELFERHDRSRFETFAISYGPDNDDRFRSRVKQAFEHFIDIDRMSIEAAALLMRDREIDIAVDLMGFTERTRLGILAARAAPIQVSYLGYPGTTGAPFMDYVIADRFVIPQERRPDFQEQVVYLPNTFQANPSARPVHDRSLTRADVRLPETAFVFCCFNNNYKINPPVFDVWMRLLRHVDGSVLWLLANNPAVEANLRREAQQRGVAPERLIFAPRAPYAEYLARFALADLFLDASPFNAGTTASDALSGGLPLLTCAGETFAGRMAGSLLNAVGLPELVTSSLEAYEQRALHLARDRDALSAIRAKLAANLKTSPLFDTDRFRRHIEAAYVTMWERWQRGEAAEGFAVEPIGGGA